MLTRTKTLPSALLSCGLAASALLASTITVGCVSESQHSVEAAPVGLTSRADLAFGSGSYAAAVENYKLAAAEAQEAGDEEGFVEAAAQVASCLALLERPADARPWLEQASARAQAEQPRGFSRVLFARGLVARAEERRADAAARFDEVYQFCDAAQLYDRALQAAQLATVVTEGEAQRFWARRAVEAASRAGEPRWEAAARLAQGWTFDTQGQSLEALGAFREARKLFTQHGTTRDRLRAEWSYARALRLTGEVAEARMLQERNLKVARTLRQRGWSSNDSEWVGRCHHELGELEAAGGHIRPAIKQLLAAREAYVMADADVLAPELLRDLEGRVGELRQLQ